MAHLRCLNELYLGKSKYSLDNNPEISADGFKIVLNNMRGLQALSMSLPHVQSLDIRTRSVNVGGMRVGDKGAEFIAKNLKNL